MVKRDFVIFCISCFVFAFISCNNLDDAKTDNLNKIYPELKPPFRIGINQIKEKDSTFEIVLTKYKERLISTIETQNPILKFNYHDRWKICYKINTNKTFDIFVVEQHDNQDAHSLMLITSKKEQPQNIISAVIVGLENYTEDVDKIESEDWSAIINENLNIKILKKHEIISSSSKEKIIDFSENTNIIKSIDEVEETYKINDDGSIVFVEKAYFSKPSTQNIDLSYRAVVAFKYTNDENDDLSNDEWMLNNIEIQNACTSQNIYFCQAYDNFENVFITDNSNNILDTINISFATQQSSKGYVMIHSKHTPSYIEYNDKKIILKAISAYFNLELMIDE